MGDPTAAARAVRAERRRTSRGLVLPNLANLLTLPSVMTSPPAGAATPVLGTIGSPPTTTISGGVQVLMTDQCWRYFRGNVGLAGVTSPANLMYTGAGFITKATASWPYSFDVMYDGRYLELYVRAQTGSKFRLRINGQYATANLLAVGGTANGRYPLLFDFGSRAVRHLQFDTAVNFNFGGAWRDADATLWRADHIHLGPRVLWFGDSFTSGTTADVSGNSDDVMGGYAVTAGELLGWMDVWVTGVGSTGYLAPGTNTTYRSRIAADVIAWSPDIVVGSGGLNDLGGYTQNQLNTEAALLYDQIAAGCPNAAFVMMGGFMGNVNSMAGITAFNAAIQPIALAHGVDLFIDNAAGTWTTADGRSGYTGGAWLTGTGRAGATNGSGNADQYRGTDTTHPTIAGQIYYGYRFAQAVAAARPF